MAVGAPAGSTVGGIKLVRAITLVKRTAYRITDVFYPDTVIRHFKLNGRDLTKTEANQEFTEAAIISFLWVVFLALGVFFLLVTLPEEFTLANVVFEVTSAQGNVGLSSGVTGPSMPTATKVMFVFNMWIGRLEIIPVIVLIRAVFVRGGMYQ